MTKLASCVVLAGALFAACATADFKNAADGEAARVCPQDPIPFCEAMAPAAGGCVGDPTSPDENVRRFPTDASFPVGCAANVVARNHDVYNECPLVAICHCAADPSDAGPPQWGCR